MVINSFKGRYGFLSNFHVAPVWVANQFGVRLTYASAEHAYQCMKAVDVKSHDYVMSAPTPRDAKRRGNSIACRVTPQGWEIDRVEVMEAVLLAKFENDDLMHALLGTGDAYLVDGNNRGDTFWGVDGEGRNILGGLLMQIRDNEALKRPVALDGGVPV